MTTDRYVIGSGPTIPTCSAVEQIRDSSWVRWRFKSIIMDCLANGTGSPNYLYSDATGTLVVGTPTWYTKTQSDARYLQSFTETDPVYTAGITNYYTKSQGDSRYLQSFTELDPVWTTASANYFTKTQSDARYLQSFTELDPVWTAASVNYYTKTQSDSRYLQSFTETDPLFNTKFSAKTTDGLTEGTANLYFTQARARTSVSNGSGIGYNSSTGVITNTAPDQTVVINSGTGINATGTYPNFTITNTQPFNPTVDSLSASRAFNTGFLGSSTKYVEIKVSASISCNLSLSGGQAGTIFLETSPDNATWTTKGQLNASNTGTLTIGLNTTQISGGQVCTMLPPTFFWRARTSNVTGTPTFAMLVGEKVTYN